MKFVLAPFAAKLPTGNRNPKDYPYFDKVIALLNADGHDVIQIGVKGENRIDGVGQFIQDWPLDKLVNVIRDCDSWISVDSFLPHFCWRYQLQPGVVIWGQSDSTIWGHPKNINLAGRYRRQFQYAPWYDAVYDESVFVSPEKVRDALYKLIRFTPAQSS